MIVADKCLMLFGGWGERGVGDEDNPGGLKEMTK